MKKSLRKNKIKKFIKIAKKYCKVIDTQGNMNRESLLNKLNKILPKLYYRITLLPSIVADEVKEEKENISCKEWENIFSSLENKLQDWAYYWDVFNPNDLEDTDSICSNLADDLADIYRDIKSGLNYWHRGTFAFQSHALWYWKFIFLAHTGQHITGAIRAIFWRLSQLNRSCF